MDALNIVRVIISNMYSRLATWKRIPGAAALALGYGYYIDDDDE